MVSTRSGAAVSGSSNGKQRALVTGGAGFLGKHLVKQLFDTGLYDVTVFDIRDAGVDGVRSVVGDLRNAQQVSDAIKGSSVVFHCATAAPSGENALNQALMLGVNVDGTKHVLDACVEHSVPHLVYTSSSSVVFSGSPLYCIDESYPYASKPMDYYTKTKILGEQMVLEANGRKLKAGGGLVTCALRPSGIFGEGDPIFVPTVVRQARAGKMKFVIGNGANMMDFTYVGNVAQSHVQAAAALAAAGADASTSPLAGKAYFITNDDPRPFWGMLGDVCSGLGYRRPSIHLPFLLIIFIAFLFEYVIRPLVSPIKQLNSDFTVNRILIATTNRTFSCRAAQKDFGYQPKVSVQEAVKRTIASFQSLKNDGTWPADKSNVAAAGAGKSK